MPTPTVGSLALIGVVAALMGCAPAAPPVARTPAPAPPTAGPAPANAPAAPAPTAATPPAPANVRFGIMYSASDAGLLLALERGHFREYALDVEFESFTAAAQMLGPLGAAQLDAGGTAITPGYLNAFARGVRIRIVADKGNTAPGWGYQGIAIRRALWDSGAVRGPGDLRGRKIVLPSFASTAEIGLDRGLRQGGITVRDVDLGQLPFPDMPAAMASGAIDAALVIEPFITRLEAEGSAVVWKREDEFYPNHQIAVVYYAEPFATQRPDVARRFMLAYLRGVRDYNDAFRKGDPTLRAEAVAALVKHTTVKDPTLYDRMVMPGLDPDGVLNLDSLREDYDYWLAAGHQEERVTLTDLVDPAFARDVVQQLGPYR